MQLPISDRRARETSKLQCVLIWIGMAVLCMPAASADQLSDNLPASSSSLSEVGAIGGHAYSLKELLEIAQRASPAARVAGESAQQADIAAQLVRSNYSPQVSVKALGGFQRTPVAIPDNVSPQGYFISNTKELIPSLELKWLLFDFGRRKGREEEADQVALAAHAMTLGTREKLAFDVTQGYFELGSAKGRLQAARKVLETALITESAANAGQKRGRATVVVVAQAQLQSAAARLGVAKASGAVRIAAANLVSTVGLPIGTEIELSVEPDDYSGRESNLPLKAFVDQAVQSRPDVLAAQDEIYAAQAKVDTAHAAYRPTISFLTQLFQNAGQVSSDGSPYSSIDKPGGAVFLAIEMPLLDGGVRANNVALAVSEKSAAEDKLDEARDAASAQVVRAYNDLKTGMEERTEAEAYVAASNTAFDATLASYKRGLATYPDLASSEAALAQALSAREDAISDVQIARSALALATGTLQVDTQE